MSARVLVIRPDNLGDVVLAGPAVRAVAASGAHVKMLCSPNGAPAARLLPGVDEVVITRLPWIDATPERATPASLTSIRDVLEGVGADEAIILTSSHQSPLPMAVLLRLAGVSRIGAVSVEYPGSLLDVALRHDDDQHEVGRALSLVEAMGYALPPGDTATLRIDRRQRSRDGFGDEPFVVV